MAAVAAPRAAGDRQLRVVQRRGWRRGQPAAWPSPSTRSCPRRSRAPPRRVDAILIHYSTDFVFSGTASVPYVETDAPEPQSVYAQSKLVGEWMAADWHRHFVVRVESLFGGTQATQQRRSHHRRPASRARRRRCSSIGWPRPSYIEDVAGAAAHLLSGSAAFGLYHCVNSGHATWLELGQEIARMLGRPEASPQAGVGRRCEDARAAAAIRRAQQPEAGRCRLSPCRPGRTRFDGTSAERLSS